MSPSDLIGQTFWYLTVVSRTGNTEDGRATFVCLCRCGQTTLATTTDLKTERKKSCNCYRVEAAGDAFRTHGRTGTAEYRIWSHMKTRCLNPKSRFFYRYGGRGITMHPAWIESFETFYRDMGPRPSAKHSIDRKENDGNYEPGNCRWATPAMQSSNRSTVITIEHDGHRDTMAGWARATGIPYLKLRRRLADGWSIPRALESKDCAVRAATP